MKRTLLLASLIFVFQNAQAGNSGLSETYENEIIERVRSVFGAKGIEEKVERPICATSLFLEIRHNWDRFSAKTKAILESYTERPPFNFQEHTYDTPEGHFKIHYVTEGDSAVPNEDWVDTCGQVLEHVWDTEINVLGYNQPPSDGWYHDTLNGGDGRYDVYLLDLGKYDFVGYTQSESLVSPYSLSATSFIVLDNDYLDWIWHSPIEWLQVTFAHEFFHAIQMGYDATEYEPGSEHIKPYWMEMSAVWMEDMVYDEVNDYVYYLPSFFNHPEWSLKTFAYGTSDQAYHPYGSCVWPMFLSERFDDLIIKEIWEECAEVPGDNVFDPPSLEGKSATDEALEAWGSSFEETFREFTVWNYFTGKRGMSGQFYEEGALFNQEVEPDRRHSQYPVPSSPPLRLPENLASSYVVFTPLDSAGGLEIGFDGQEDGGWRLSVIGFISTDFSPLIFETHLDTLQDGNSWIYNWFDYKEIVLIPAATARSTGAYSYSYSARYDSSLHGEQLFPPWITISGDRVKTAFVDEILTFQVKVTDQNDKDTLAVEKTGVGDFGYIPGASPVVGTFSWIPTAADTLSPYPVIFTADDGHGGTDKKQVQIIVETKPHQDVIGQNFPNPFVIHEHDSTFFPFDLSSVSTTVDIWIYNIAGELVRKMPSPKVYEYGHYGIEKKEDLPFWDGKNDDGEYVSSGIYLYRVKTKNSDVIKKMAVIR